MQLFDSTAAGHLPRLRRRPSSSWPPSSWSLAVAPVALRETRNDRMARRESIPTYYGRLHFAH